MPGLISHLIEQLAHRPRPLPPSLLRSYVSRFLEKRDLLLAGADTFGTPHYVFDEPALCDRLRRFQSSVSKYFDCSRVYYAVKSNPFEGILNKVLEHGMGLDVSSGAELSLALSLGAGDLIFSGPGKTVDELTLAVENREKVTLLLDSFGELDRLANVARKKQLSPRSIRIGIRVRKPGPGMWNRFGISLEDLGAFLEKIRGIDCIQIDGLQFHTSWNLNPDAQIRMLDDIDRNIREKIPSDLTSSLRFLDIGGGYWPEQGEWLNSRNTLWGQLTQLFIPEYSFNMRHYYRPATSLDGFMDRISRHLKKMGPPLSCLEIRMEPGRWLSTPSMHILLQVLEKKDGRNAVTDGGTCMLGWERPMTEYIPVINLTRPSLDEKPFNIVGSLCTPLDVWGWSVFGQTVEPGDILLIPDQGAYTYTLRQAFIKPLSPVIHYDGKRHEENG